MIDNAQVQMTESNFNFFVDRGCVPACHICDAGIFVGNNYVMREIARRGDTKVEMMACIDCRDKDNPAHELSKANEAISHREEARTNRLAEQRARRPGGGCLLVNGSHVIPRDASMMIKRIARILVPLIVAELIDELKPIIAAELKRDREENAVGLNEEIRQLSPPDGGLVHGQNAHWWFGRTGQMLSVEERAKHMIAKTLNRSIHPGVPIETAVNYLIQEYQALKGREE